MTPHMSVLVALAGLLVGIFGWIGRLNNGEIKKCSRRIVEIEREINSYSRRSLLRWESYWGGTVTSFYRSADHIPYIAGDEPPQWNPQPSDPQNLAT